MPTHEQHYITCSSCGNVATDDSRVIFGETALCVRSEVMGNHGWLSNVTLTEGDQTLDYCQDCVNQARHCPELSSLLSVARERVKLNYAIDTELIDWDEDDADDGTPDALSVTDFQWHLGEFDLRTIGSEAFKEHLVTWIDKELMGLDANHEWVKLRQHINSGGHLREPVTIAVAWQPGFIDERLHIADGWHRIAMYVAAKRDIINAHIGLIA
ncbi:hypothetical protein AB6D11_18585 [Vibrio splendidus]